MHGGWVGSDVGDKVPKKRFFLTPSLSIHMIDLAVFQQIPLVVDENHLADVALNSLYQLLLRF